ncbi:hypothetical protein M758_9G173900 [Ceratodon purpureus]|uniref:Uncharacterized protein n=1 Tax=Ceratodon purpureus TaxID=3225 RepID=A0A8T0I0P0_CERPU|nr:hypothetical protein KC19_5G000100 [Ceratodon purpureus]KAG0577004.1 hypothetical protein KC19_5G124600 [Ceratodon purpureus]KAG0606860.1 hypothetical protein M758_9G173900 [Ceratodon purpureus]
MKPNRTSETTYKNLSVAKTIIKHSNTSTTLGRDRHAKQSLLHWTLNPNVTKTFFQSKSKFLKTLESHQTLGKHKNLGTSKTLNLQNLKWEAARSSPPLTSCRSGQIDTM